MTRISPAAAGTAVATVVPAFAMALGIAVGTVVESSHAAPAPAPVTLSAALTPTLTPTLTPVLGYLPGAAPCTEEDASAPAQVFPCTWDAATAGNGEGTSYTVYAVAGGQTLTVYANNAYAPFLDPRDI